MAPQAFFGIAVLAGSLITIQSVLNSALGERTGNLGSVLILTVVSIVVLIALIGVFPGTADLRHLPGLSQMMGPHITITPNFQVTDLS